MRFSGKILPLAAVCAVFAGGVGVRPAHAEQLFDMDDILFPFWEGTTSYQESVTVVEEEDGTVAPIRLLYPIEQVLSVKSASLTVDYSEGKDYEVADGKLVVKETGAIPRLSYAEFHPQEGTDGFENREGGYVLWKEGSWYHARQIVVTYTHAAGYDGYIPEGKGKLLPKTLEKLGSGKLDLLVYGDSISTGGNSSGHPDINTSPYMPIYPELFAEGMRRKFGAEVNVYNHSVGGTDSAWGLSNLRSVLSAHDEIDLAIVAFGMNDTTRDAESYANNIQRIARGLKSKYKDIEILLVAPMLPNYDAVKFYGNQENFYDALKEYEEEGCVAVDVTGVHRGLLGIKRFADMTGNNVNHANDFLARVYAQTLLRTLDVTEYGTPEPPHSEHMDEDNDGKCDVCGENMPMPEPPDPAEPTEPEVPTEPEKPDAPSEEGGKENSGCGAAVGLGAGAVLLGAGAVLLKKRRS